MNLDWLPATLGVIWVIVQTAYMLGRIGGRLDQIEKRLSRLENRMNHLRKEG